MFEFVWFVGRVLMFVRVIKGTNARQDVFNEEHDERNVPDKQLCEMVDEEDDDTDDDDDDSEEEDEDEDADDEAEEESVIVETPAVTNTGQRVNGE